MTRTGIRPLTEEELSHKRRAAAGALPVGARQAMRRLRRGQRATSVLLRVAARRTLLRLGGVRLGSMVWGLERCYFESEHVSIGDGCAVNAESCFEGHGRIAIGHHCFIGPQVMIITWVHEIGPGNEVTLEPSYREVRIGDRCWIGARATILPGVSIGAGNVVAAESVVSKDCEPGSADAGVPARRLR